MLINRLLFLSIISVPLVVGLAGGLVFFGIRSGFRMGVDFMLWLGK